MLLLLVIREKPPKLLILNDESHQGKSLVALFRVISLRA
jgi:hypothetical protein